MQAQVLIFQVFWPELQRTFLEFSRYITSAQDNSVTYNLIFKGAEHVQPGEAADNLPRGCQARQLHVPQDRDRPGGYGV